MFRADEISNSLRGVGWGPQKNLETVLSILTSHGMNSQKYLEELHNHLKTVKMISNLKFSEQHIQNSCSEMNVWAHSWRQTWQSLDQANLNQLLSYLVATQEKIKTQISKFDADKIRNSLKGIGFNPDTKWETVLDKQEDLEKLHNHLQVRAGFVETQNSAKNIVVAQSFWTVVLCSDLYVEKSFSNDCIKRVGNPSNDSIAIAVNCRYRVFYLKFIHVHIALCQADLKKLLSHLEVPKKQALMVITRIKEKQSIWPNWLI